MQAILSKPEPRLATTPEPAPGPTRVRCYLCGGTEHDLHAQLTDTGCGTPGKFDYVRCRGCGLVFQNPRLPLEDVLGRYPEDYISNGMRLNVPGRGWSGRLFERILLHGETQRVDDIAKRHPVDASTRILDVGCGDATFLHAAQRARGAQVVGVELNEDCCRYARESLGLDLMCSLFEEADFDAPFDVITMWHFLEHEYDPLTALARARLLLNDDGLVVVQVPNIRSLGARLFGRKWNGWDAPRHTVMFSRDTLAAMLRKAGLEPVEMTSPSNCWGALLSLRLLLGMGLRFDPARHFLGLMLLDVLTTPFELASHMFFGGEWITCYARRA
jgi:2-polyprenyl-3-methyl-5-hydroxy-6-metoxy-1,4-benzoquinol methylase